MSESRTSCPASLTSTDHVECVCRVVVGAKCEVRRAQSWSAAAPGSSRPRRAPDTGAAGTANARATTPQPHPTRAAHSLTLTHKRSTPTRMSLRSQHSAGIPARPPPPGSDAGYSGYGSNSAINKPSTINNTPVPSQGYQSSSVREPVRQGSGRADDSASVRSKAPSVSLEQSRHIARVHFDALHEWLRSEGAFANGSTRNNAREKLTRYVFCPT